MVLLQFKTKQLTKGDLYLIEKRLDEIERIIELCSDDDVDVLENLERETQEIIERLEND